MADDQSWLELMLQLAERVGLKRIIQNLAEQKHHVLVVGSTGVGKTALVGAMKSIEQKVVDVLARTERIIGEKVKLKNKTTFLVDTPGEIAKITTRMTEVTKVFQKPRVGMLIVVANGYHEYDFTGGNQIEHRGAELNDYLETHRKVEERYLASFAAQFPFSSSVDWAMTVATKADLWWPKRSEVIEHYSSQRFTNLTRRLCLHGAPVRPFSAATEPFMGTVEGYASFGEKQRRKIREEFIDAVIQNMAGN